MAILYHRYVVFLSLIRPSNTVRFALSSRRSPLAVYWIAPALRLRRISPTLTLAAQLTSPRKDEEFQKKAGTKAREIRVCFDANAIYNESALYLLPLAVKEVIERHSSHSDVALSWYIPKMVRGEREFRMQGAGEKLLPEVAKLETLFGVNLNITKTNVREQVTRRIDQEIADVGLRVLGCDSARVEWERVYSDAASRLPPFQASPQDKEKGFRDLVIGESFLQLVEDSPRSKKVCQIVLVTNDGLLTEMVRDRSAARENVKVLADVAAVDEYINTLASEATEEYVESLRDSAADLFLKDPGDDTSFYYSSGVSEKISKIVEELRREPPEGAEKVTVDKLRVLPPNFAGKSGQRVTWLTRIVIDLRATKEQTYLEYGSTGIVVGGTPALGQGLMNLGLGPLGGPSVSSSITITPPPQGLFGDITNPPRGITVISGGTNVPSSSWKKRETTVYAGQAEIEVQWSATVTTAKKKMKNATIVSTTLTKTDWRKEA